VPRIFEALGVRTDVVEINPDVVKAARKWFGFGVSGTVFVDDARHFLATADRTYDYVVLDVFSGDTTPSHLLSVEAMKEIEARLAPGGVMAVNYIGSLASNRVTASVERTIRTVFPSVSINATHEGFGPARISNIIFIASRQPLTFSPERVASFPVHPLAESARSQMWKSVELPAHPDAIVLSDDFNPVDAWDLAVREDLRRNMLESTDLEVLL
jgi:predicted membrane-bound spermidine synthase